MEAIFFALAKHWKLASIAALFLTVASTIIIQRAEIGHLERKLVQAKALYAALDDDNRALIAAIKQQNAAVAALKNAETQRLKKTAAAAAKARQEAQTYKLTAQQIASIKTPDDECAAIKQLVNRYVTAH